MDLNSATKAVAEGQFDLIIWDFWLGSSAIEKLITVARKKFPKATMIAASTGIGARMVQMRVGCDLEAGEFDKEMVLRGTLQKLFGTTKKLSKKKTMRA